MENQSETKSHPSNMELTRFDRNLAENIFDFSIYKEEERLAKNIVVYLAHDFQKGLSQETLFGKKILDPVVFAKTMGYQNYRSLMKPHKKPYQFEGMDQESITSLKADAKKKKITLWDTEFCNALYKLFKEKMVLSKPGKTPAGVLTNTLTEMQFLKSLTKFYHPVSHKIYYEYELQEAFINNLARYFLKISVEIFAGLRKSGLQDFYISLINIRDKSNRENKDSVTVDWLTFDALCRYANTNCSRPSDNKLYINKAIKKINKLAKTEMLSIEWEKNGNHRFKPILRFSIPHHEIEQRNFEFQNRFNHYMLYNLKRTFRETHPFIESQTVFNQRLVKWLKDPNQHFELKQKTYIETYAQVVGKEIDRHDNHLFNYITQYLPNNADKIC